MNDIIRDGIVLAVYLFIVCSIYIFISDPVTQINTDLSGLDVASDSDTQNTYNMIGIVFNFMFIMLTGVPLFWFIMRIFQRDPEWWYNQ